MSKKYSSNDEDKLLCEAFKAFVQSEAWEKDPNPYAKSGDKVWRGMNEPGWKSRERNWGVEDEDDSGYQKEVSVNLSHIPDVLKVLHSFMQSALPEAPAEPTPEAFADFFQQRPDLLDELLDASRIAYVSSRGHVLASALHKGDVYTNIMNIDNFRQTASSVLRSILKHVTKSPLSEEETAEEAEESAAIDELIDIIANEGEPMEEAITPEMIIAGSFAIGVLAPVAWFFTKSTLGGLFNALGKEASTRQWKETRRFLAEREKEIDEQRKAELILLVEFLTEDPRFDMAMKKMAALIKKRPRSEAKKKQLRKEMRAASIQFNKIVRQIISDNKDILTSKKAETFVNNIREMLHSGELQAMDRAQEFAQTREDPGEEIDSEEHVRLAMEEPPYEESEGEMQAVRGRAKSAGKLEESQKIKVNIRRKT